MSGNKEFVGSVKIKPVVQEITKSCAGGMIAVSSGILFFWIHGGKPLTIISLIMLSLHAAAIPLLVAARIFYLLFDQHEFISAQANRHLERLLELGLSFALSGYFLVLWGFNKFLFTVFAVAMAAVFFVLYRLTKDINSPATIKRV